MGRMVLVSGGSRSGKSRFAQTWIEAQAGERIFLATCPCPADDAEMQARLARHRQDRSGRGWRCHEETCDLAGAVAALPGSAALLIDCLGLWCSNRLAAAEAAGTPWDEDAARAAAGQLVARLAERPGPSVLVTNEVGLGTVPMHPVARRFVDCLGRINQTVAAAADTVVICWCGLPQYLKGHP